MHRAGQVVDHDKKKDPSNDIPKGDLTHTVLVSLPNAGIKGGHDNSVRFPRAGVVASAGAELSHLHKTDWSILRLLQ